MIRVSTVLGKEKYGWSFACVFQDTPSGSCDNIPLSTFSVSNPSASARPTSHQDPTKQPLLSTEEEGADRDSNGQVANKDTDTAAAKTALLAQGEDDDGLSVDSYDLEKNPFFSD